MPMSTVCWFYLVNEGLTRDLINQSTRHHKTVTETMIADAVHTIFSWSSLRFIDLYCRTFMLLVWQNIFRNDAVNEKESGNHVGNGKIRSWIRASACKPRRATIGACSIHPRIVLYLSHLVEHICLSRGVKSFWLVDIPWQSYADFSK